MSERSQAQQENIPPELFAESKVCVCAVEIVQQTNHSVALVELKVMIVVELRRGQEGQVIA